MSFSNAGNVWVWDRMGLYGRHGGHVRQNTPALDDADAWIVRHGARKGDAAEPEPAPKPAAAPAEPSAEALAVRAARAKYGRIHPEAFHAKRDALRKGWSLVRGIPTWTDALYDRA